MTHEGKDSVLIKRRLTMSWLSARAGLMSSSARWLPGARLFRSVKKHA